jgi:hypothetical protein
MRESARVPSPAAGTTALRTGRLAELEVTRRMLARSARFVNRPRTTRIARASVGGITPSTGCAVERKEQADRRDDNRDGRKRADTEPTGNLPSAPSQEQARPTLRPQTATMRSRTRRAGQRFRSGADHGFRHTDDQRQRRRHQRCHRTSDGRCRNGAGNRRPRVNRGQRFGDCRALEATEVKADGAEGGWIA